MKLFNPEILHNFWRQLHPNPIVVPSSSQVCQGIFATLPRPRPDKIRHQTEAAL